MEDTLALILLAGVPLLIILGGFIYYRRSVKRAQERKAALVRERLAKIREEDYQRMRAASRRPTVQSSTQSSFVSSRGPDNSSSSTDDLLALSLINSITSSSESTRVTSWSSSDSSSSWSSSDSSSSWSSSDSGPSSDW